MKLLKSIKTRIHCFLHPEENLRVIQADIKEWADRALPGRSWSGQVDHLRTELVELDAEKDCPEKAVVEAADIIILALNLAGTIDVDVCSALIKKMEINKKRKWELADPATGRIHHIGD